MVNFLKKILRSKPLFYILVVITFAGLFLDSYKYSGFVRKHFLVDPLIPVALSILLVFLYYGKRNYVFKINRIILPILFIVYLVMEFFETKYYHNYVFSRFHIQPQNFFNLVLYSGTLRLAENTGKTRRRKPATLKPIRIVKLILLSVILITLASGISGTLGYVINSDFYMLNHLSFNYDDKMRERWGFYYDYMKFVQGNTPENSKILIPPQEYYATSGNAGLDRYFLYPRVLGNGTYDNPSPKDYGYVLVNPGWPREPIKAEKVILFLSDKDTMEEYGDYDPSKFQNSWGLIKLK